MKIVITTLSAIVLLAITHIGVAGARDYGQPAGPQLLETVCAYQLSPGLVKALNSVTQYGTYSTARRDLTIGGECSFRSGVSYVPSASPYNHV